MISRFAALAAFGLVSACGGSSIPDSNPRAGNGVGFGSYDSYQAQREARDRALETAQATPPISEEQMIASEAIGVLEQTRGQTVAAVGSAQPAVSNETVVATAANPSISDEQNFDAVASRESIESDAERLQQRRVARTEVAPQPIPQRPSDRGPNIVAFALQTTNAVGQPVYRRSGTVSQTKFKSACARYPSSDQAQEAFLNSGGPRSDRRGLDPDGDGFACSWDPTPFRTARGG